LELFKQRYYALVFKTELTREELRKLKFKFYPQWTLENVKFLLKVYRESKNSLNIVTDIEKNEKRLKVKELIERSKTPHSVTVRKLER
jgi:hypothetical protein